MKLSYHWLQDYIDLPDDPIAVAELITAHVAEVERVETLDLKDTIITIDNKTLTHRPDLFCHIGFARELSVILNIPLKLPAVRQFKPATSVPLSVTIQAPEHCRRYMGVVVDNVIVQPSPAWLQQRLRAVGLRPINNVVDITNYVMYEYGQPLHAFDYDQLTDHHIIVRLAESGEKLITLDGKTHQLTNQHLVIADTHTAQALAGIMGGAASEINSATTRVVIESANFTPTTIRLEAQALGIRTDGSTRHEKNLPLAFPELGLWRMLELLQDIAGAQVASAIIDERTTQEKPSDISLDVVYVQRLTGAAITREQIVTTLKKLGCDISGTTQLNITPPVHRSDLTIAEDLIEEVARMHGYSNIEPQPLVATLVPQKNEPDYGLGDQLIYKAAQAGAYEVMNYSFYSVATAQRFAQDVSTHLRILNPMNPNQVLLRTDLRPNLLLCAEKNLDHGERDFTLVEYGHVYRDIGEQKRFGLCCVGSSPDVSRTAKGLATWLGLNGPVMLDPLGKWYAAIVENDLSAIHLEPKKFQPLPEFPGIELDISVEFPNVTPWSEIDVVIKKNGGPLVTSVAVFDVYKNALGIRLKLQSNERTLTMDEAEKIRDTIIQALQTTFKARHRY